VTILTQSPCLHGGVVGESCHSSERKKRRVREHIYPARGYNCLSILYTGFKIDPPPHADSAFSSRMIWLFCVTRDMLWLLLFDLCCLKAWYQPMDGEHAVRFPDQSAVSAMRSRESAMPVSYRADWSDSFDHYPLACNMVVRTCMHQCMFLSTKEFCEYWVCVKYVGCIYDPAPESS
jgi:hypothetical protein